MKPKSQPTKKKGVVPGLRGRVGGVGFCLVWLVSGKLVARLGLLAG